MQRPATNLPAAAQPGEPGSPTSRRRLRRRLTRSAPAWSTEGVEPDYRFTLANERTFLAWLRTALAMLAGAAAVTQFLPADALRDLIGCLLAGAGCVLSAGAYPRWAANQRAMRAEQPLPHNSALIVLSAVLGVTGVVGVVAVVVSGR